MTGELLDSIKMISTESRIKLMHKSINSKVKKNRIKNKSSTLINWKKILMITSLSSPLTMWWLLESRPFIFWLSPSWEKYKSSSKNSIKFKLIWETGILFSRWTNLRNYLIKNLLRKELWDYWAMLSARSFLVALRSPSINRKPRTN